jgi:hypothetical protein
MRTGRIVCSMVVLGAVSVAGCGRPTLPGGQLAGRPVPTSVGPVRSSSLPTKPYVEWGDAKGAKVRIYAFYMIDDRHKALMDLFKSLADQYRGKVYVKYTDYRTVEGQASMARSKASPDSLLLNGSSEFELRAKPHPYTIQFTQEIGRYWTPDDLKKAVAQAVGDTYGGGAEKP